MYQVNEVVNMLFDTMAVLVFVFLTRDNGLPSLRVFYLSIVFIILAHIFTIAEGFILYDVLNLLEHVCYLLSALAFFWGVLYYFKMNREGG